MQERFKRLIFIILLAILLVWPVLSQEINPTLEPMQTANPSPTISIPELTPEMTLELSPTPSPTATQVDVTAETSPEVTAVLVEETVLPELTVSPSATVDFTEAVELTAEVTESSNPSATSSSTPTATIAYNLAILRGIVSYQNRLDNSAISVSVYSLDGVLISLAETNTRGVFSLPAPADMAFILVLEAPLHRSLTLQVNPNDSLPSLVLAGGDLDNDGCINNVDMQRLLVNYELSNTPESDINADGVTDLSDLAILTGNFDAACGLESTEAANP